VKSSVVRVVPGAVGAGLARATADGETDGEMSGELAANGVGAGPPQAKITMRRTADHIGLMELER
jgi:hypothetical protein